MTHYDVDVYLTTESPDPNDRVFSGPFDGGFCETYSLLEKLANECGGGWEDWEPYRCTYSFSNKENSDEFCRLIVEDGIYNERKIHFESKEWDNEQQDSR